MQTGLCRPASGVCTTGFTRSQTAFSTYGKKCGQSRTEAPLLNQLRKSRLQKRSRTDVNASFFQVSRSKLTQPQDGNQGLERAIRGSKISYNGPPLRDQKPTNESHSKASFQALNRVFGRLDQKHATNVENAALQVLKENGAPLIRKEIRSVLVMDEFRRGMIDRARPDTPLKGALTYGSAEEKSKSFKTVLKQRLSAVAVHLSKDPIFVRIGLKESELLQRFETFVANLHKILDAPPTVKPKILQRLQDAYRESWTDSIDMEIKHSFYGYISTARFTKAEVDHQRALADLRHPGEWFSGARAFQRRVHLHVGPTNSGKTYQALKRLEEAEGAGIYAGPLRLLAHEVYLRLNARGKPCFLITGEEHRDPTVDCPQPGSAKTSCTVEMTPLSSIMKVAVIDEIQMIGSAERGWAWTQAYLGVQAEEVHLCGEERAVPIIQELAAAIGDKLEIHRYQRLSPLKVMVSSLRGNIRNLVKGDCVVTFSIMDIHGLRQLIEKTLKKKVAVIYGSLPPETRAQQAKLFNDPFNDYDFLVASDAVGMGLNLNIKRMIFHTTQKFYANRFETISVADIKQIAGRAGRFSTAEDDMKKTEAEASATDSDNVESPALVPQARQPGLVTTLETPDYPIVKNAMRAEPEPILSAGLFPPASILEAFARYFPPKTPFSYVLVRLHELSQIHPRFHLCSLRDAISIADAIELVDGLSINDKIIFCSAPISTRKVGEPALARALAQCIADNQAVSISDMEIFDLELLEETITNRSLLKKLEHLHKGVMLYIWLSYRFSGVFVTRALAFHVKALVESKIELTLANLSIDLSEIARAREKAMQKIMNRSEKSGHEQPDDLNTESGDGHLAMPDQGIDVRQLKNLENEISQVRHIDSTGERIEATLERD